MSAFDQTNEQRLSTSKQFPSGGCSTLRGRGFFHGGAEACTALESRLIVADDSIAAAVNVTLRRFIDDVNNMQTVGPSDASVCLSRGRGKINARADRRVYLG